MSDPTGFEYHRRGAAVVITHHGVKAAVLRGQAAAAFMAEVEAGAGQAAMARATGNYKRGNERRARQHPRNRAR